MRKSMIVRINKIVLDLANNSWFSDHLVVNVGVKI